jgi:choline dehydrogenase
VTPLSCEVAVVGGGTAGCVVAGRLAAETDADVILLEAGPDYGPLGGGRWPGDLLDAGALPVSHGWGYASGPLAGREQIEFSRARVLGGCSSHNGCVAAVGCAEDYDGWAELTGDPAWSAASVRPLVRRVLERLRVRVYPDGEIGPFHRACLEAAAAVGWPRLDDLHDLDGGVGFGSEPVNVVDGTRFNAAFAYVDPARGRPNLRILDEAVCDRLVPSPGGLGVVARRGDAELRVRATTVVLCAGAYGTPAFLQRSGVGDPARLEEAGIPLLVEAPGVGANLHDHPLVEVAYSGSDELTARQLAAAASRFVPEEQTLGKLRSSRAGGPYDLHLFPVASGEHSLLGAGTWLVVSALEPRSRGRVDVRSADPLEAPVIDHGYLTDPDGHDLAVLVEGVALARELAGAEPLTSLAGVETAPGLGADLPRAIRRLHAHYFHPVGTCAMGTGDDAVCDGHGRVRGLEGVVVADCSLMPVVPRANTNVPAALVGERIAGLLA